MDRRHPSFQAESIQGNIISRSDFDGKFVLLEFWATWCSPCMPEIPHLKTIHEKYSDSLQIVGISLDKEKQKLEQFINERKMTWPQIIQPKEWNDEIVEKYNVSGIPRTYIIGKDGKIVAKDLRGVELEAKIAELLQE